MFSAFAACDGLGVVLGLRAVAKVLLNMHFFFPVFWARFWNLFISHFFLLVFQFRGDWVLEGLGSGEVAGRATSPDLPIFFLF